MRHYGEPEIADPGYCHDRSEPGQIRCDRYRARRNCARGRGTKVAAQLSGVAVTVLDDEIVVVLGTSMVKENEPEES